MKPLRIFTWQVHGNYLYYLSHLPHEIFVPYNTELSGDYAGCFDGFPWPKTVINVPVEQVRTLQFDCILYQRQRHYLEDQYVLLTREQQRLPGIYLEHDPPQEHPTNTEHLACNAGLLLVHVTPFNNLMWDNGRGPTRVIDHGVVVPPSVEYTGELEKGLVVVNNIRRRGRRLGLDIFEEVRRQVPLDIVGMGSQEVGGLGEISHEELPRFEARYRFLFNPIRYTSMGLAVCEAMQLGMPVVGIATTEMATAVRNGVSGFIDTDIGRLVAAMRRLLDDPELAKTLGRGAREYARSRFGIDRFVNDWNEALSFVTG